jgi:hypothetical protein
MAALTVVATPEPVNSPPRIRLDVTDTGSPAITSVTVTRTGPEGTVPVRTETGGPLVLTPSGGNQVGLLYDYEAITGEFYTYSTVETPVTPSASVHLDVTPVWLIHPGVPALSMPITMDVDAHTDRVYTMARGVFTAFGRADPIVITDGARKSPTGTLIVHARTATERASLRAILDDGTPLLLNIPVGMDLGVGSGFLAIGDVTESRRESWPGIDPLYTYTMDYQVVRRPVGGTQAERTYGDVLADNATYDAVRMRYDSYSDLLAGVE